MAGYSGTPLPKKLGIKPGHRVLLFDAPETFEATLGEVPPEVELLREVIPAPDIQVLFVVQRSVFEAEFALALKRLPAAGAIWVAWPKRASKVPTDMTENVVREVGLPTGVVDNKVCAIDSTWSGLRLVVRKTNRAAWTGGR
jgi:hypothetical protein